VSPFEIILILCETFSVPVIDKLVCRLFIAEFTFANVYTSLLKMEPKLFGAA
jgi:hypothetical protein